MDFDPPLHIKAIIHQNSAKFSIASIICREGGGDLTRLQLSGKKAWLCTTYQDQE